MPKVIKLSTVLSLLAAILTAVSYHFFPIDPLLTLTVTFGTIAYHLLMRLSVGASFGGASALRPDCYSRWYRTRPWEQKLYDVLCVKTWKRRMPTYSPEEFSPKLHSWEEIAESMCRSERIHEISAFLSFVPLIASIWFGAFLVFLITSLCGAAFDLALAVIQRYNRARIAKIASRIRLHHH